MDTKFYNLLFKYATDDIERVAECDENYAIDSLHRDELKEKYEKLNLDEKTRSLINDYITFIELTGNKKAKISYDMAVKHTVSMLKYLKLI